MPNEEESKNKQKEPLRTEPPKRPSLLFIFFMAILFWFIFNMIFGPFGEGKRITISYTTFKTLVDSGKVEELIFTGNEICILYYRAGQNRCQCVKRCCHYNGHSEQFMG